MRLLLIRHGKIAGDPYILPERPVKGCLSELGLQQANTAAEALASETIDVALSSPYGRALQTAEIVMSRQKGEINIVHNLHEWLPAAKMRGLTSTEYAAMEVRDRERYAEETWKTEAGEGAYDMYARIIPSLLDALAQQGWHHRMGAWMPDEGTEDKCIAIFAHGGTHNIVLSFLLGLTPFPVGRFSFDLTGVADIRFTERRNLFYPNLKIGVAK